MRKLLLSLLFLPVLGWSEVISINQFSGLNTDDSPLTLQNGQTPDSRNVLTDDGPSLQVRNGFLKISTEPAKNMWEFPKSDGTVYQIVHTGSNLKARTSGATFNTFVATVASGVDVAATVLGDSFYFSNTVDGLRKWDGSTVSDSSTTLTVDKLVTHKGRIWAAGKTGSQRTIFGSAFLDGDDWDLDVNPTETSPVQITVSGSLDDNIEALYASFRDGLIWMKQNSFGVIFGSRRSNFSQRVISDQVGVSDPRSIQDCDGLLRWLGPRREVWEFDGANFRKISEDVDDLFATVAQGDSVSRSDITTTKDHWDSGAIDSGYLATNIISGDLNLSTMSKTAFIDNTQSAFESGDFSGGTQFENITCSIGCDPVVQLATNSVSLNFKTDDHNQENGASQLNNLLFTSAGNQNIRSVKLFMYKDGSPSDLTVNITEDDGGTVGTILASFTIDKDDVPSGFSNIAWVDSSDGSLAISSGTQYWINIPAQGSAGNQMAFGICEDGDNPTHVNDNNSTCDPEPGRFVTNGFNGLDDTDDALLFDFDADQFYSSGTFISRSFDMTFDTNTWLWKWGAFDESTTVNDGTVTYKVQVSTDDLTWSTTVQYEDGETITEDELRYIRYQAVLETDVFTTSPYVLDVSIPVLNNTLHRSTGVYTSEVISVGDGISAWSTVGLSETDPRDEVLLEINSSTSSDINDFSSGGWTAIDNGETPTISTNPYAAFRMTFDASTGTVIPSVQDVTVSWIEGSTISVASVYSNQRYWLGVSISSTNNNAVLVFDKKRQWQRFDSINMDSAHIWNSNLYYGNSSGVFQAEIGNNDNGASIEAYYKTALLAPSGPDVPSFFDYVYLTTENSDSTIQTSYQINQDGTDYSLGSYLMNTSDGIQNIKVPFYNTEVQRGKFIDLKWTVTGSDFWRLINANLYYKPGKIPE